MTLLIDASSSASNLLRAFFVRRGREDSVCGIEFSFNTSGDRVSISLLVTDVATRVRKDEEVTSDDDRESLEAVICKDFPRSACKLSTGERRRVLTPCLNTEERSFSIPCSSSELNAPEDTSNAEIESGIVSFCEKLTSKAERGNLQDEDGSKVEGIEADRPLSFRNTSFANSNLVDYCEIVNSMSAMLFLFVQDIGEVTYMQR